MRNEKGMEVGMDLVIEVGMVVGMEARKREGKRKEQAGAAEAVEEKQEQELGAEGTEAGVKELEQK